MQVVTKFIFISFLLFLKYFPYIKKSLFFSRFLGISQIKISFFPVPQGFPIDKKSLSFFSRFSGITHK